jgi:hypothetical protein
MKKQEKLAKDKLDKIIDFIIDLNRQENFKNELSDVELSVLRQMTATKFFELSKTCPFKFTKRFFNQFLSGFLDIPMNEVVDYIKQFKKEELKNIGNTSGCNNNRFLIACSYVNGQTDFNRMRKIVPNKDYPMFFIGSELHQMFVDFGEEDKFFKLAQKFVHDVINEKQSYNDLELVSDDVVAKLKDITLNPCRYGFEPENIRKTIRKKLVASKYFIDERKIRFLNSFDKSTIDIKKTDEILGIGNYILFLNNWGIRNDYGELKAPKRELVEELKKIVPDKKQNIEEVYQFMLPKQQIKQHKVKL